MKSPSMPPPGLSDGSRVPEAVHVQIMATEHWNLLATRSMIWNEAFSRASVFLTVLSAGVVALAFVAQADGFGHAFRLFALVVLTVVLLVGMGTYSRLVAINTEDFWLVVGMNRLRHGYLEIAPELEPYFVTGHHDDIAAVMYTDHHRPRPFGMRLMLSSTAYVVGGIDSLVAGVLVALIALLLGAAVATSAVTGAIGGVLLWVVLLEPPARWFAVECRDYRPLFPVDGNGVGGNGPSIDGNSPSAAPEFTPGNVS